MVHPGIQIKPIEGDALLADTDLNQIGADLRIEAVPVHPDIEGGVAKTDQARDNAGELIGVFAHVWHPITVTSSEDGLDRACGFRYVQSASLQCARRRCC